jgi:fumarylacetoacetase
MFLPKVTILKSINMTSWVQYLPDHPFPVQNLPFGCFSTAVDAKHRLATVIGDYIVDLSVLAKVSGLFSADVSAALQEATLNKFMSLGYGKWKEVRETLTRLFSAGDAQLRDDLALRTAVLIPVSEAIMHLPATIGDYTDFYASKEHASNLGAMFRPGQPALKENWLHMPIGYHGRASSVVVSGTPLVRPNGQKRPNPDQPPVFGPSMMVDFELEMGAWIGTGNTLGTVITTEQARTAIFGYSLFNDWSARDIQKWEYEPLGPFLGKNFGSTVSPWIVSTFALEPFMVDGPAQDPEPLPYLKQNFPGNVDLSLSVTLKTAEGESMSISSTNYKYMYWSAYQMVAHHSINGCNMNSGDLLGSGTISGPVAGSYGSMIEIAWQGTKPITFPSGAQRKSIQDGDTLTLAGECIGQGYRIGFGDCSGTILPALKLQY